MIQLVSVRFFPVFFLLCCVFTDTTLCSSVTLFVLFEMKEFTFDHYKTKKSDTKNRSYAAAAFVRIKYTQINNIQ